MSTRNTFAAVNPMIASAANRNDFASIQIPAAINPAP
jgi:hypothetical protein